MTEIGQAYVRIRPNVSTFKQETTAGIRGALLGAAKLAGGIFAVEGLARLGEDVVKAAANQVAELAAVHKAVDNVGAAWVVQGKTVEQVLKNEAEASGFAVAELGQGFIRIESGVKNTAKSIHLLKDAEDIARARHLGLAQASVILARAAQGSDTALRRLGIIIPKHNDNVAALTREHGRAIASGVKFNETQKQTFKDSVAAATALDKQQNSERVINEIRKRFGGQSDIFAKSSAGQFARFREAEHQLSVSIGQDLLPALSGGVEGLTHYIGVLRESEGLHQAVRGGVEGVKAVFIDIKQVVQTLTPVLSAAAHGIEAITSVTGAQGLIAFAVGFKAIGVATGIATAARARYATVLAAAAGPAAASVTAEEAQSAATTAYTVALEANTAALLENAAASGLSSRLRIAGALGAATGGFTANTIAVEANTAAMVENEIVSGGLAARSALIGRGLFALAGGPMGLATVAAGLFAFGLYKVLSAESGAEIAGNHLAASLDRLGNGLARSRELAKQLSDAVSSIHSDKIAVETARTNVALAEQALATTTAKRGSLEYEGAVNNLAQAQDGLRLAQRQLLTDERAAAKARSDFGAQHVENEHRTQAAILRTSQLASQARADALVNVITPGVRLGGGVHDDTDTFGRMTKAARAFADQLDKIASKETEPSLRLRESELAAFARAAGRVPTPREVQLVLGAPDDKAALNVLTRTLAGMRKRAAEQGFASGAAFALSFKNGLDNGSHVLFNNLLAQVDKFKKDTKGAGSDAFADVSAQTRRNARNEVSAAQSTIAGLAASITTAQDDVASAARSVADSNLAVADAIKQGADSVRAAQASANQNLFAIGSSLSDAVGQFLDAQNKSESLSGSVDAATFRRLRAQILAGQGGDETRRAAQELAARLQSKQGGSNDDLDKRKERVRRGLADLVDEFNKGAISLTTFNKRVAALLAKEGLSYKAAGKALGIAFADGFQASVAGLRAQAAAIAAGPRVRGRTGQEPSIIRPLEALRDSQRNIASAQRSRDDALRAESKAQTKLQGLLDQRARLQLVEERAQRRLAALSEQHLKHIKHEAEKQTKLLQGIKGPPKPKAPPRPRGAHGPVGGSVLAAVQGLNK